MARIRSVKPEFWTDRKVARVSRDARLLYISLWNQADEHGRLHGDARYVKGHCLPYDDDLGLAEVDTLLNELWRAGRVQRYEVDGEPYLYLPKLAGHQRLEPNKAASRLPEPPGESAPIAAPDDDPPSRSAPMATESLADPREARPIVAQQVAGSRGHVAGGRVSSSPLRADAEPDGFAAFWDEYPRRVGKQDAIKAYRKALTKTDPVAILAGALAYRNDPNREPEFTAHPATWLNRGGWEDDPLPARGLRAVPSRVSEQDETLRRWHDQAVAGQMPELGA